MTLVLYQMISNYHQQIEHNLNIYCLKKKVSEWTVFSLPFTSMAEVPLRKEPNTQLLLW